MRLSYAAEQLVALALAEDLAQGDVTSASVIPADLMARAEVLIKAQGVLAGLDVARAVCVAVDGSLAWQPLAADGQRVDAGAVVATIAGSARSILAAERTLLNFMQRLSGIATLTARYVTAVEGTGARLVDTRKTTPGWRALEKAAVRAGGGHNHRFNLGDGVLIKDNHLALAGQNIAGAVAAARANAPHTVRIEVEVESLDGLRAALEARADIILLDNMSLEMMREAVGIAGDRALLEASGGITLERIRAVAETGVDLISCGAVTHSATALDISLEMVAGD
jgi:nicotinate-nucleotide pyrophosphorylase (carboxylating)